MDLAWFIHIHLAWFSKFRPEAYQGWTCFPPTFGTSYCFAMDTGMFGSTDHDHVFTGVIRVTTWCDGSSIGQRVPSNEPYMVIGLVLPEGNVSLYGFQKGDVDDSVYLHPAEDSWWFCHAPQLDLSPRLLELCAGVGGMGVGASFAGGIPFVSVDHNGLSCSHLNANHHGEILQLDLTLPESARIIHMCDGQNSIHVVRSWHRFIRPPIATHSPSTLFTN